MASAGAGVPAAGLPGAPEWPPTGLLASAGITIAPRVLSRFGVAWTADKFDTLLWLVNDRWLPTRNAKRSNDFVHVALSFFQQ
jgi:hypothetical protein